jgi:hypothetical protein
MARNVPTRVTRPATHEDPEDRAEVHAGVEGVVGDELQAARELAAGRSPCARRNPRTIRPPATAPAAPSLRWQSCRSPASAGAPARVGLGRRRYECRPVGGNLRRDGVGLPLEGEADATVGASTARRRDHARRMTPRDLAVDASLAGLAFAVTVGMLTDPDLGARSVSVPTRAQPCPPQSLAGSRNCPDSPYFRQVRGVGRI